MFSLILSMYGVHENKSYLVQSKTYMHVAARQRKDPRAIVVIPQHRNACMHMPPATIDLPGRTGRVNTNKSALRSAWTVQCYLSSRGEKYGAHLDPIAAYPVHGACLILRELTQAHLTMTMDLRLRRLEIPRPHASPFRSLAYIYTHQL